MEFHRFPIFLLSALLTGPATFVSQPPLQADELPFSHYTSQRSTPRLPSTSVQNVHQDRLGFLWLATFSTGVVRYDGQRMETFGLDDGVIDPTVREIVEDAAGHLWLGGEAGVMVTETPLGDGLQRPRFTPALGDRELPRTRVRHHWLEADPESGVWLATAGDGIIHLQVTDGVLARRDVLVEPGMDVQPVVSALTLRGDGTLWAALGTASVLYFDPSQSEPEIHALDFDAVPETPIGALAERDGVLWAGDYDGRLWRLDEASGNFEATGADLGETIKALYAAPDGIVWAGSLGGGVARFDPVLGSVRYVGQAEGLPSATVWDLEVDREGTLWICHNGGLSKLRADYRAFRHLTGNGTDPVLPEPTVFGVLPPADDGLLFIGTGAGLTVVDSRESGSPGQAAPRAVLTTNDGLSSSSVYASERDAEGRIWLGTAAGLDILSFDAELPSALLPAPVRRVEVLGRQGQLGNYGFSTAYSVVRLELPADAEAGTEAMCLAGVDGVACRAAGKWYVFGPLAGLPASGATAVTVDAAGHLWVGTKEAGALRSTAAASQEHLAGWAASGPVATETVFEAVWDRSRGAASDSVRSFAVTGDRVWVAHAAGLDALDVGGSAVSSPVSHALHLGAEEGLGGDHVVAVQATADGARLWVAANAGIAEIDAGDGRVLRRVRRDDGLLDDETWVSHSLALGDDGTVYFGTPSGLTIYDPTRHRPVDPVATAHIRRADVRQSGDGNNRVELAWTAATYLDENDVRFSTRLAGLDDDWSEPSGRADATYTHLPAFFLPRTYTFEVRISATPGVWLDEVLRQEITVEPPWWWSWWALLLWIGALALVLRALSARRTAS